LPPALPAELVKLIKNADRASAYLESTRLAGFDEKEARKFFGNPPEVSTAFEKDYLTPWTAKDAEARYLKCFATVTRG
jgi:hypothetical protein